MSFEINVSKETFKFNAAHFVAFPGFRERLHGHNYRASVRLIGNRIGTDGYVLDFGDVKKVVKQICKDMNEYFLLPMLSDVLQIDIEDNEGKDGNVQLLCEDGARFSFPKCDCYMLPIVHSTAEELAVYLWGKILLDLDPKFLVERGIHSMEVTCAEAIGQEAIFRHEIPKSGEKDDIEKLTSDIIRSNPHICRPCNI